MRKRGGRNVEGSDCASQRRGKNIDPRGNKNAQNSNNEEESGKKRNQVQPSLKPTEKRLPLKGGGRGTKKDNNNGDAFRYWEPSRVVGEHERGKGGEGRTGIERRRKNQQKNRSIPQVRDGS